MDLWQLLLTFGVPSTIMSIFAAVITRKLDKHQKDLEKAAEVRRIQTAEKEKRNEEFLLLMLQSTTAAVVLSEATAKAVQRIPDAHCNGDMHSALEYAAEVQQKQKDFLLRMGIKSLHSVENYSDK